MDEKNRFTGFLFCTETVKRFLEDDGVSPKPEELFKSESRSRSRIPIPVVSDRQNEVLPPPACCQIIVAT